MLWRQRWPQTLYIHRVSVGVYFADTGIEAAIMPKESIPIPVPLPPGRLDPTQTTITWWFRDRVTTTPGQKDHGTTSHPAL
jgi:hypothetical protein